MPLHLAPSPVPRFFPKALFLRYTNATQRHSFSETSLTQFLKAIGAAQDAARMERVVSFYAGLPRGPAPQAKATGLLGRYQARYFNKNSPARKLM